MTDSAASEKPGELVAAAIDSDAELLAIKSVFGALVPLKREARARVLDYVLNRLGVAGELSSGPDARDARPPLRDAELAGSPEKLLGPRTDIRSLTQEKAPRSANEMAALVAYYLTELAPEQYRKQVVTKEDVKTYFKQANFPLPSSPRMTLINAKNAGYLESSGPGQYRLNPVGYNLVVHGLPAQVSGKRKTLSRKAKQTASRAGH